MPDRLHIPGERPRALRWTDQHPQSHYGNGVLLYRKSDHILDGHHFRLLRDGRGAWLETQHPDRTRRALGVPLDESLDGRPLPIVGKMDDHGIIRPAKPAPPGAQSRGDA